MADKLSKGTKPQKKVIMTLEDCFKQPEVDGGEEKRNLWHFYREESDENAIIRRVKRDAYEHQCKYLMCAQGVVYSLCMNLGIGNIDVYKAASYVCGGMGGSGICGALVGARMAMGVAYGRSNMYEAGWPREVGETHLWNTLPVANDELNGMFADHFGSIYCNELHEKYFGRSFFLPSDYEDPKILEMDQSGLLYRIVSTYAASICEWTAGVTAEIILREWSKLGIPIKMPFR